MNQKMFTPILSPQKVPFIKETAPSCGYRDTQTFDISGLSSLPSQNHLLLLVSPRIMEDISRTENSRQKINHLMLKN
jgi:hypothetical protein